MRFTELETRFKSFCIDLPTRAEYIERGRKWFTNVVGGMPDDIINIISGYATTMEVHWSDASGVFAKISPDNFKTFDCTVGFPKEMKWDDAISASFTCNIDGMYIDLLSDGAWYRRLNSARWIHYKCNDHGFNIDYKANAQTTMLPRDAVTIIDNAFGGCQPRMFTTHECISPMLLTFHEETPVTGRLMFS